MYLFLKKKLDLYFHKQGSGDEESNIETAMEGRISPLPDCIEIKSVEQYFAPRSPINGYYVKEVITFDSVVSPEEEQLRDSTLEDFQNGRGCWVQTIAKDCESRSSIRINL